MIKIVNTSLTDSKYPIDSATWSISDPRAVFSKQDTTTTFGFKGQVNTLEELKSLYNLLLQQKVGFETYIYFGKSKVCINLELLEYQVIALGNNLKTIDIDDAENFNDFNLRCNQYDMNCYRETMSYGLS